MKQISSVLALFCMFAGMKAAEMNNYAVVLAGGVGERLWPLSRANNPKQFLSVCSKETLLDQSLDRLRGIVPQQNLWVVTSQTHADLMEDAVGSSIGNIVVEPVGRNTGPAILYTCLQIAQKNPDAVVVFTPADPYIPSDDTEKYQNYVSQAVAHAARCDSIILCGVEPTYPATGYGYIERTIEESDTPFFDVARFHEKPTFTIAQYYFQQKTMLWNIGMFIGKVSVFIDQFKSVAPELYDQVTRFVDGNIPYEDIESVAVDCAVIEKSNHVKVLPVDFSWCDVGNVDVFLSIKDQCASVASDIVSVDSQDNMVDVPNKLVALVGVHDLCVVETPDALLIAKRSEAEKVRAIVQKLKQEKKTEYL